MDGYSHLGGLIGGEKKCTGFLEPRLPYEVQVDSKCPQVGMKSAEIRCEMGLDFWGHW